MAKENKKSIEIKNEERPPKPTRGAIPPGKEPEPEKLSQKESKGKGKGKSDGDDSSEDSEKDYLLKYQYGRDLPLGDKRSNPSGGKSKAMKDALLSQPKVRVMIPADSGSSSEVPFSVNLNGYRLDLPRNQYIDVPQQIAEVIMNSHNQTEKAINQFAIGGNKEKEEALS